MFSKKQKEMPKGNWKASLAFSPTSTVKPQRKELERNGDPLKREKTAKPKKRGNTKREISKKTAEEVKQRDHSCIICQSPIEQIHHAFYGIDANYGKDRNTVHQLVGLCTVCHDKLHSRGGNEYRKFCKEYLKGKYPTQ